ncbi:MAG: hypothetical protein UHS51_05450 [Atopobiaceae bacterium]|nr:hypothetical protein [Atopobiaceae bacterium]
MELETSGRRIRLVLTQEKNLIDRRLLQPRAEAEVRLDEASM